MTSHPAYTYPPLLFLQFLADVLVGRRRSFHRDGLACILRLRPPLRLLGEENIPHNGPCLITFNHYFRSGFHAWWLALGIAAVVPVEMHWVATGELTYPGRWYAPLGRAVSRRVLRRVAGMYGFTTMPPMPPRPQDVEARARAVRLALAYARAHPDAILGLAPEGGDQPGGALTRPPSGAGRFIALLAGAGFKIVPVGAYEEAGEFCLHFGEAYDLQIPSGLSGAEKDRRAAEAVMTAIARWLPRRLQGEFG